MTTWVLLRGLTRETRHWEDFASGLRQALPAGHEVMALDLPGNGLRCEEASPWSIGAMVHAVRAELLRLDARPPFVPLALSLGAMVALEWSCQATPGEMGGCVLVNTSARGLTPFWQRLRPGNYMALARMLLQDWAGREATILALTSQLRATDRALAQRWATYAQQRPVSAANAFRQLTAAMRYRLTHQAPAVPGLVLASAADRFVSCACSQALAQRWGWPLRLHASAGHDLPLDAPDWVVAQCVQWWDLQEPTRSSGLQHGLREESGHVAVGADQPAIIARDHHGG